MIATSPGPVVSVVIATHDRPGTLRRLLLEIREQTFTEFEVIVVDDQSSDGTRSTYQDLWLSLDERFKLHYLPPEVSRNSPGVTRNYGVRESSGQFIAFCDDDDRWIGKDHLSTAIAAMKAHNADLFLANMQTSVQGKILNPDYYSRSWQHLARHGAKVPGHSDLFRIDRGAFSGFFWGRTPHVNTIVVTRGLFERAGPFWERIVFAEDHDWMFRIFDKAERCLFRSSVVADLDVGEHRSVARSFEMDERYMFSILACIHAGTLISHPALRQRLRQDRAGRLLALAESQIEAGRPDRARELALESLRLRPSRSAVGLYLSTLKRSSGRSLSKAQAN